MRVSQLFLTTLRTVPGETALPGQQLLWRAGFIRPAGPGSYSLLPLGLQARRRLEAALSQALQNLGGQEISLPASSATTTAAGEMPGWHADAVLAAARSVIQSYRQLPALLYHFWQPADMEGRRSEGLFSAAGCQVADIYSLHADRSDLAHFYGRLQAMLADLCQQCDIRVVTAAADWDVAGAARAHTLIFPAEWGPEEIASCGACGYAAMADLARCHKDYPEGEPLLPMHEVETPGCKTIADLAAFLALPRARTAKALFLIANGGAAADRFIIAIVRGDNDLSEAKLRRVLRASTVRPATEEEIRRAGAEPGYGSPVGVRGATIVVDDLVAHSANLVAGANRPGYHLLNVNCGRDYQPDLVADIILAPEGSPCPECGHPLQRQRGVQVALAAQIGDGPSRDSNTVYLDRNGQAQPIVLGYYRFYSERLLAAVAESHHDPQGLCWPPAVAPYQLYLMTVGKASPELSAAADQLYAELRRAGLAVLYDDREERAGVKFNDADLIGLPLRIAVGERGLQEGIVELKHRRQGTVERVQLPDVAARVRELLSQQGGALARPL